MVRKRRLRICHVITRMIVGGAQENTLLSVVGQRALGHDVELVTGESPGREGRLLQFADLEGVKVTVMPDLVREISPLKDWRAYRRLRDFFRQREFDVVHTHSSKAGVVGRAAAWDSRVPVVVHTVHGQAFHRCQSRCRNMLYQAAERFAAHRCHRIYAVAQAMIDQCVDAGVAPRELYRVVYSGMEMEKFLHAEPDSGLRESLGIPGGAPVVATLARLSPQKGYEYVLPAAFRLLGDFPDVHFLVIGDGPMHDGLLGRIAEAHLEGHFHFAGLIAPDDVPRHLALCSLLWHLSLHEGLPRSVVQALASGRPAIGFRLDGTPEVVIDGETGYCVAPGDVGAVVSRSLELLRNPVKASRMGENGRGLVRERFDWRRMCEILESDYQELAAAAR